MTRPHGEFLHRLVDNVAGDWDPRRVQHEVTDECWSTHCHWHQVDEEVNFAYLSCGECFHSFATKRALRSAYRRTLIRDLLQPDRHPDLFDVRIWWHLITLRADKIYSCPFCSHDF